MKGSGRGPRRNHCDACGAAMTNASRCDACGGSASRDDLDDTAAVPQTRSSVELLLAHRADLLREQLGLRAGESVLLFTRGAGAGSSYRLGGEVVSLGRSTTATIVLDDVSVSRRHAEIHPAAGGYRIVDVGSLNGTYVNDVLVDHVFLAHGDEIRIGLFKLVFLSMAPPVG